MDKRTGFINSIVKKGFAHSNAVTDLSRKSLSTGFVSMANYIDSDETLSALRSSEKV